MTDTSATQDSATSSLFDLYINILSAPNRAFDEIRSKGRLLSPLLLAILGSVAISSWYFAGVDIHFLADHLILLSGKDLSPDQVEAMRANLKPEFMLWASAIGSVVGIAVIYSIQALYLLIVGNIRKLDVSFGQWFALVCWTGVPALLGILMIMVNMAVSDTSQLGFEQLNPLNFAGLLGLEAPSRVYNWAAGLSIFNFWALGLGIAGLKRWSNSSWLAAGSIILIPYLIIWSLQLLVF